MRRYIGNHRFLFCSLLGLTVALFAVGPLLMAKEGIVHTTDGKSLEGDINETGGDTVTILIHGVLTTLPRDTVASIDYTQGIEQQYKERLAKVGKNDAKGHLELAKWLLDKKSYLLASQEVDAALAIEPNNADANTLYQIIQSQRRLEATSHIAPPSTNIVKPQGDTTVHEAGSRKYLPPEDINFIKQTEWKENDGTVRVHMEGDVVKRFTAYASINPADFKNGLTDQDRAWRILTEGLPEMHKDVRILNDPAPMAEYRTKIQPLVLNGCATVGCHGGPPGTAGPGGLFLYNPPENEAATYTNFFLLDTYSNKHGKMIDRTYPDRSLVCEYALPAGTTDVVHPEVPKGTAWKGIVTGKEDPRYKLILSWVRDALVAAEPKYNITFSLEKPVTPALPIPPVPIGPTTAPAPAVAPASAPAMPAPTTAPAGPG